MPDVPKFAFPFERDPVTGKVEVVEQDSDEHVLACDEVVVRCPIGFRHDRPEFGWAFPAGRTPPFDLSGLQAALLEFGHENSKADVTQWTDVADAALQHIDVEVSP